MVHFESVEDVVVASFDGDTDAVVFVPGSADTVLCIKAAWESMRQGSGNSSSARAGPAAVETGIETGAADVGPLRDVLAKIGTFFH